MVNVQQYCATSFSMSTNGTCHTVVTCCKSWKHLVTSWLDKKAARSQSCNGRLDLDLWLLSKPFQVVPVCNIIFLPIADKKVTFNFEVLTSWLAGCPWSWRLMMILEGLPASFWILTTQWLQQVIGSSNWIQSPNVYIHSYLYFAFSWLQINIKLYVFR